MREAFRKLGLSSAALIFGVCLALLGAKFWLIQHYGSDLPFGEQWNTEFAQFRGTSPDAFPRLDDLLQPQAGDRVILTRTLAAFLLRLNGQWDSRLERVVNAVVHVAAFAVLLIALRRAAPKVAFAGCAVLGALLFGLPFSWGNTLDATHSSGYFLELFSFLHLSGTFLAPPRSQRRWWAQGAGLGAVLSRTNGYLSAVVVLALIGVKAFRQRTISRSDVALLSTNLGLIVIGLMVRSGLRTPASSLAGFWSFLFEAGAWPSPLPALFVLALVPLVMVGFRFLRRPDEGHAHEFVLGLSGWWVLQLLSLALSVAPGSRSLLPGSFDLLGVGVVATWILWLDIVRVPADRGWLRTAATVAMGIWLLGVAHGLWFQSVPSASTLLASTVAGEDARLATTSEIAAILPSSVRGAIPVFCDETASSGFAETDGGAKEPSLAGRPQWSSAGRPGSEAAHFQSAFIAPPRSHFLRFWVKGTSTAPSGGLFVETTIGRVAVEVAHDTDQVWRSAIVETPRLPFRLVATSAPGANLAFTMPVELPLGSWLARQLVKIGPVLVVLGTIAFLVGLAAMMSARLFRLRFHDVRFLSALRKHPGITTVVVAAMVLFIRKTDVWLHPQFWAEDGPLFFAQNSLAGSADIFAPYAGYLHFLPRCIALFATHFAVLWTPTVYVYASIGFTLVVVALIFSPRLSLPFKPLLALAIVSVPHTGEVFLTITNLQWITALGLVLVALKTETSNFWAIVGDGLIVAVFGLTGPFIIVLFPLYLLRVLRVRSRANLWLLLIVSIVAAIQGESLLNEPAAPNAGAITFFQSVEIVGFRTFGKLLFGDSLVNRLGAPLAATLGWSAGFGIAWFSWRNREHRHVAALLWVTFVLLMGATMVKFGGVAPILLRTELGDRYFYLPLVILCWLIACAFRPWPRVAAVVGILIFAVNLAEFRFPAYENLGWEKTARRIEAKAPVHIEVNPGSMGFDYPLAPPLDFAGARGRFGESGLAYLAVWTALMPIGLALSVFAGRRLDLFRPWSVLMHAAVICLLGYGVFWAYFASPTLGALLAWSLWLASVAILVIRRRELGTLLSNDSPARDMIVFSFFIGFAYLAMLYFHGSTGPVDELAANRFVNGLPVDNQIPRMFAERLLNGESPRLLIGDWLSSDRPPLQTGLILLASILGRFLGLSLSPLAHGAGLWFQLLWVPAVWAFALRLGLGRRRAALLVIVTAMIGFFVLNSLYVWPKLGGAALVFAAFCLWFGAPRTRAVDGLGAGLLAGLAYLAHGGVAFSLLAFALMGVGFIRRTRWPHLLLGVVAFGAMVSPWLAYQKFYEPPANRLFKMHLAGVTPIDSRGTLETIVDSYRELGWKKTWENKRDNLVNTFKGDYAELIDFASPGAVGRRNGQFFYVFFTLGQWNMGWILVPWLGWKYWKTKDSGYRLLLLCLGWAALTYLDWILLMFGGIKVTIIHQSSYAMHLTWFAALLSAVLSWNRWVFYALAAMQMLVLITTWLPGSIQVDGPLLPCASLTLGGVVVALLLYCWLGMNRSGPSPVSIAQPTRGFSFESDPWALVRRFILARKF